MSVVGDITIYSIILRMKNSISLKNLPSIINPGCKLNDLAVLRLQSPIPQSSIDKAEKAYDGILPLKKAIERFQERPDFRQKCFQGLQVDAAQIPKIIDGVDLLSTDLSLSHTSRVFREQHDIFTD